MNGLILKGTTEFMGNTIPNIYGGFGEDKKAILAKTIAETHGKTLSEVNQIINRHINRFKDGIDVIDLARNKDFLITLCYQEILTQNSINRSSNIYLLSERGYSKLIKAMGDDLSWEMHDQLIDNYFALREEKENQLVNQYLNLSEEERAILYFQRAKEVKEAEQKLIAVQEVNKKNKPKVEAFDSFIATDGTYNYEQFAKMIGVQKNKMLKFLRAFEVLQQSIHKDKHNVPYAKYVNSGIFVLRPFQMFRDGKTINLVETRITSKGVVLLQKFLKERGFKFIEVELNNSHNTDIMY